MTARPSVSRVLVIALLVLGSAAGCARASLTIQVDMYAKDPTYVRALDEGTLQDLRAAVRAADVAAGTIVQARTQLAWDFVRGYRAYHHVHTLLMSPAPATPAPPAPAGPPPDTESTRNLGGMVPDYETALQAERKKVSAAARSVEEAIEAYRTASLSSGADYFQGLRRAQGAIAQRRDALQSQLLRLANDNLDTPFETHAAAIGRGIEVFVKSPSPSSMNRKDVQAATDVLKREFAEMAKTTTAVSARGERSAEELRKAFAAVDQASTAGESIRRAGAALIQVLRQRQGELASAPTAALAAAITTDPNITDQAQNLADPVWREVTQNDAEGKGLWNPVFSKTEFYAEGNTSVVVARDRSGRFRVQLAKNDPRVLIESQLRISQAIGSGLAEVLAAATGAGGIASLLPGVNSTGTGDTGTVPQTSIASESVALDAAAAARRTAIDGLVDQLDAIGGTVRGLAAGANVPADVLQRLRAALEAHKILLTPPAAPSPATTTTTTTSTTSSAGSN